MPQANAQAHDDDLADQLKLDSFLVHDLMALVAEFEKTLPNMSMSRGSHDLLASSSQPTTADCNNSDARLSAFKSQTTIIAIALTKPSFRKLTFAINNSALF